MRNFTEKQKLIETSNNIFDNGMINRNRRDIERTLLTLERNDITIRARNICMPYVYIIIYYSVMV